MSIQDMLARRIVDELKLDEDQYEIIRYGAFAFIQIIISIMTVTIVGFIFGVMLQALIVSFSTSILRQYSGGAHASKPATCLVIGTTVSVGLAVFVGYISKLLYFPHYLVILPMFFLVSFYIVYKKAPVDSAAKPIRSEAKQKKMKKKSLIVVLAYILLTIAFFLLYLFTHNTNFLVYSLDISGGMLFQIFSLTIIGHKILAKIDNVVTRILYRW